MKQYLRILVAALDPECKTTGRLACETGLSVEICSAHVSSLIADGLMERTARTISSNGGPRFKCFTLTEAGKKLAADLAKAA